MDNNNVDNNAENSERAIGHVDYYYYYILQKFLYCRAREGALDSLAPHPGSSTAHITRKHMITLITEHLLYTLIVVKTQCKSNNYLDLL